MGGGDKVEETPQQRALATYATQQLQDYQARWLPVQRNLAQQVQAMGKPGSAQRQLVEGSASTDIAAKFNQAQQKLEAGAANNVGLGSSRAKLGITGLDEDQAKSKGLGLTAADQQVDNAYTQALGALAAAGRGERAQVGNALGQQASMSARQAESDAQNALEDRAGKAQLIGKVAGAGLQQGMASFNTPTMPVEDRPGDMPFLQFNAMGGT